MEDWILTILIFPGVIIGLRLLQITLAIFKSPSNNPKQFLRVHGSDIENIQRIVFVGDSLTHGSVQPNWTKLVEERFGPHYYYINAGINSETTSDLLARLEEVIDCKPNFIILLIGNNNLMGSYPRNSFRYKLSRQEDWNITTYAQELRLIIEKFQTTGSKIAIFSILPYGEIIESEEFRRSKKYNEIVVSLATEYNLTYLDIFGEIERRLLEEPNTDAPPVKNDFKLLLLGLIVRRGFLLQDWTTISEKHHLKFLVDNIHINELTASMMADMVIGFIESNQ